MVREKTKKTKLFVYLHIWKLKHKIHIAQLYFLMNSNGKGQKFIAVFKWLLH